MTEYTLHDGSDVTRQEIEKAFKEGRAVIIHGRAEGKTTSSLMLDGEHWDTRGECYSMWEETWTREPKSLMEALRAAGHTYSGPETYAVGYYSNTDKRYCMLNDSEPGTFSRALKLAHSRNAIPTQKCHHAVMACSSWTKRDDALPDGKNLTDFLDHP